MPTRSCLCGQDCWRSRGSKQASLKGAASAHHTAAIAHCSPLLPRHPVPSHCIHCRGVHPSVTTFNCLLAAASDSGSYEALLEVGAVGCRKAGGAEGLLLSSLAQPIPSMGRLVSVTTQASCLQLCCCQFIRACTPSTCAPPNLACLQVGRALASADPDTKAACMNAYVAGLVKVGGSRCRYRVVLQGSPWGGRDVISCHPVRQPAPQPPHARPASSAGGPWRRCSGRVPRHAGPRQRSAPHR